MTCTPFIHNSAKNPHSQYFHKCDNIIHFRDANGMHNFDISGINYYEEHGTTNFVDDISKIVVKDMKNNTDIVLLSPGNTEGKNELIFGQKLNSKDGLIFNTLYMLTP
eukprot:UN07977